MKKILTLLSFTLFISGVFAQVVFYSPGENPCISGAIIATAPALDATGNTSFVAALFTGDATAPVAASMSVANGTIYSTSGWTLTDCGSSVGLAYTTVSIYSFDPSQSGNTNETYTINAFNSLPPPVPATNSGQSSTISYPGPLPVSLLSFSAQLIKENRVELNLLTNSVTSNPI